MDINGPIRVGVVEPSSDGNYELHIDFTDDFQAAGLAAQGDIFRDYLSELAASLKGNLDGRDAQGVMLIQQICEQLKSHIEAGEVALAETLVVEVKRTPGVNLADLLRG